MKDALVLMVGTRKGLWIWKGNKARRSWKLEGPSLFGSVVQHVVLDPRDGRTMLMAASAGHLGPTVFRSSDGGKKWMEAKTPPRFPKAPEGQKGESVKSVFWLTPGHASRPKQWYAGGSPHSLFRSDDGGESWEGVKGFNEHPMRPKWRGEEGNDPPDSPNTHSIIVDPRDPKHLYMAFSTAGIFESTDEGAGWKPLNKGVECSWLPDKFAEYGHDPHCLRMCPSNPDRLYHQNHCGIYRLDRPGDTWTRIGNAMPKDVGDIGFPMVLHPRDEATAWVFPMDGTKVWPRTSVGGKPAAYVTRDGGKSWKRLDKGFPKAQAWWTVKRQAMCSDGLDPVGLYVGTTQGEVWTSRDEGRTWGEFARHLPHIYSVETGRLR
jgi:photosystem II stability/assembly factor-like uncharacterized protein